MNYCFYWLTADKRICKFETGRRIFNYTVLVNDKYNYRPKVYKENVLWSADICSIVQDKFNKVISYK